MKSKIGKTTLLTIMFLLLAGTVAAVDQLISLQGKVTESGVPLDNANLVVTIWNESTGGTAVYNSTTNFNNAIQDGYFDVMLGSTTTLDLNDNQYYWLDIKIGTTDIDWSGSERKQFESTSGDTVADTIDMSNNLLQNIGAAGTDFNSSGGLILADDFKLPTGYIEVCQSASECIKIEQTSNANFTTNTGDLYIDSDGNIIYLNGKTVASGTLSVGTYLTIKGGRIDFNGTASAGDIYMDTNNDIVIDPDGGDIVLVLG